MDNTEARVEPIRLNFESKRQVVVSPDDEDRFVTTEGEAALACKRESDDKEFKEQFLQFLTHLHDWCSRFTDVVRACYVTVGDSSLNVLICLHKKDYNFDFEDTIVDLDIEISQKFPLCIIEVLQVPNQSSLTRDLPDEALFVYGDGRGSQETSSPQ